MLFHRGVEHLQEWDLQLNSRAQSTVVTTKKDSEEKKVRNVEPNILDKTPVNPYCIFRNGGIQD